MLVYNTQTHKKKSSPIDEGKIRMYVCGPTVYDRSTSKRLYLSFDVIRRYPMHKG